MTSNERKNKFRVDNRELFEKILVLQNQISETSQAIQEAAEDPEAIAMLASLKSELSSAILELNAAMQEELTPIREFA